MATEKTTTLGHIIHLLRSGRYFTEAGIYFLYMYLLRLGLACLPSNLRRRGANVGIIPLLS